MWSEKNTDDILFTLKSFSCLNLRFFVLIFCIVESLHKVIVLIKFNF